MYLGRDHVALGPVKEVIASSVLQHLYDLAIEVVRLSGCIFMVSVSRKVER